MAARKNQRIAIKSIKKMLGLQIWISTVFREARQFLMSSCDSLRISLRGTHFYPVGCLQTRTGYRVMHVPDMVWQGYPISQAT